jgi:hypothetical protein
MSKPHKKQSAAQYREALERLQKTKAEAQLRSTGDRRSYSLEGLRLVNLLRQVQSLQAVQGLAELRPREKGTKYRFEFPEDGRERSAQRQWLLFKADWLESLLEDTLDELLAMDEFESRRKRGDNPGDPGAGGGAAA